MKLNSKEHKEKNNIKELAKEYSFFKSFDIFNINRERGVLHMYIRKNTGSTWIVLTLVYASCFIKEIPISPFWSYTYERRKAQRSYRQ